MAALRTAAGGCALVITLAYAALSGAAANPREARIAFLGDGRLLTVGADGRGSRPVTGVYLQPHSPAWSPDGQRLAFVAQVVASNADSFDEVFVVKRDGAARGRVTTGVNAFSATWSPDGTRLLLTLSSARGSDGMAEVLLSERPQARLRRFRGSRERVGIAYSPDGGSIVFQELGSIYVARIGAAGLSRIRRIAPGDDARWIAHGRALAILQDDAIRSFPLGGGPPTILVTGHVSAFDVESGGDRLVIEDHVARGNSDVARVYVVRRGSGARIDVTGSRLEGESPAWQPRCTITGSPRADRITGTAGDDVICALEGNDSIRAGGGADTVIGGEGDDVIEGGTGADLLFGGAGRDSLRSRGGGRDVVDGGPGVDSATADPGRDTVRSVER